MASDTRVDVLLPALGISVAEGTIVRWRKQPGDAVAVRGADLRHRDRQDRVRDAGAGDGHACRDPRRGRARPLTSGRRSPIGATDQDRADAIAARQESVLDTALTACRWQRASPVPSRRSWRGLPKELGVDLAHVKGTGAAGRIRKQDVVAAIGRPGARSPRAYVPPPPVALSHMRRSIGAHMKRSLDTAATVTSWIEVDFSAIERARRRSARPRYRSSPRRRSQTLAEFPDLNAWLDGERFTRHETVNLGIAVALGGRADRAGDPLGGASVGRSSSRARSASSPGVRAPASWRPTSWRTGRSRSPTPASSARSWRPR